MKQYLKLIIFSIALVTHIPTITAKTLSKETDKPDEITKSDSLEMDEFEKEIVEQDIKNYDPEVLRLITELQDTTRTPIYRGECAYHLGRARDIRSIQFLIQALHDKEVRVRVGALHGLEIVCPYLKKEKEIIPELKEALVKENEAEVQLAISEMLIKWKEKDFVIPFLFEIFKNANEFFIKSREEPSYYDTLIVKDEKGNIKSVTIKRKMPIEGHRVQKGWRERQQLAIAEFPERALGKLIKIGNDKVITELEKCSNHKDKWVRQKAKWALEEIKQQNKGLRGEQWIVILKKG